MSSFVSVQTADGPIMPDCVVVLDPSTGMAFGSESVPFHVSGPLSDSQMRASPVNVSSVTKDSLNNVFDLSSCSHVYVYASGLLTTDSATDGTHTWVKTYSYTSGVLTGESAWVKQ